jgi:hypothetical protein
MKIMLRKFSLFLSLSTAVLLVSKMYWGNSRPPQENE